MNALPRKWSLTLGLLAFVGIAACDQSDSLLGPITPTDAAFSHVLEANEQIYLIENGEVGTGFSTLYFVELTGGEAQLTPLVQLPAGYEQAHVGATPNGSKVFAVNREGSRDIGYYDAATHAFVDVGEVTGIAGADQTVLVAFAPDGQLYLAGQNTDHLYRISDPLTSQAADDMGDMGIDLLGADIAFAADGTFFVWSNATGSLYTVEVGAEITTTLIGGDNTWITGLALRDAGMGDLLGSDRVTNNIDQISKTDGTVITSYPMMIEATLGGGDWVAYDHIWGDMSVGELFVEQDGCTLTQGYWKNHPDDWPTTQPGNAFFDWGMSWMDVLNEQPKGDAEIILAHQYIAAALNVESGATAPAGDLLSTVEDYFSGATTADRDTLIMWAEALDDYNNGLTGPGHCDDE